MTVCEKRAFQTWYDTVQHCDDFLTKILQHCVIDVEVLCRACVISHDALLQCTQLDSFAFITLASSCMGVGKTLFLPKDAVAVTYDGVYMGYNKTYSHVSMQWLECVAHRRTLR